MAYEDRREIYRQIECERDSKVIAYVTGDRPGFDMAIGSDAHELIAHHLDEIGPTEKISLILYTQGGDTLAAWSIANLCRMFGDRFEVIVPSSCHSAGTLICLGADNIVMTKQATLSPIDPSVSTALNPMFVDGNPDARVPVSVEDINAFIEQARESLPNQPLAGAFDRLASNVHPLVIGTAFRTRSQIRMLGRRLLGNHMDDGEAITRILDFLCSESGSHDYTVNRREARDALGLPIETPSWDFYHVIKSFWADVVDEFEMRKPFNPRSLVSQEGITKYTVRGSLIESAKLGSHMWVHEGVAAMQQVEAGPGVVLEGIQGTVEFEGWRFHDASDA